jgi:hypothetical protein
MTWKCLIITPFGWINCNYVYALLLWGLLLISASRYSDKVHRMAIFSTLTFKSAPQSCLRIHLDYLVNIHEQSIWSSRLPQEMQRRLLRWAHTSSWDSISSNFQQCDCLENLLFPSLAIGGVLAPREDDGTDFGCIWIQSNGLIALKIKCCCMRLVNSCSTMLFFGSW